MIRKDQCMEGNCIVCPFIDEFKPSEETEHDEIKWNQWSTNSDGKADKIVKVGSVDECFNELKSQLPQFLLHTHVKCQQASAFQEEKKSTKVNHSKLVIQKQICREIF